MERVSKENGMINQFEFGSRRDILRRAGALGIAAAFAAGGLGKEIEKTRASALPDVVHQWFGAWQSDDPARTIASLYSPDGYYEDIAAGTSVSGPDIESYLAELLAAPNGIQRDLRTSFASDILAVAEQLITAMDDDGINFMFQVYAVTVFEHDGSKILRSADYYDSGSILMQLGSIPAAPWFSASTSSSNGRFCKKSG